MTEYEVLYDCLCKHNQSLQQRLAQQAAFVPTTHTFFTILGAQISSLMKFLRSGQRTCDELMEILTSALLRTGMSTETADMRCLTVFQALRFCQQEFSDFGADFCESAVLSNPVYIFSGALQTLLRLPKGIEVNVIISKWFSQFLLEVTPAYEPLQLADAASTGHELPGSFSQG